MQLNSLAKAMGLNPAFWSRFTIAHGDEPLFLAVPEKRRG